jgi:hypothetical protein
MISPMGYVYILRHGDEDLFKIGMTRGSVEARMKTLVTGNPHGLAEYDSIETDRPAKVEAFLQGLLRTRRSRRSDATEFYAVTPDELDAAIKEARDFNEQDIPQEAEVEMLAAQRCTDAIVTPGDADWDTYTQLLATRAQHDAALHAKNRLEWKLKLRIGTASALEGIATWKTLTAHRFDQDAFAEAHPDLHATYQRETYSRRFDLL